MRPTAPLFATLLLLLLAAAAVASDQPILDARSGFEKLKSLAGEWQVQEPTDELGGAAVVRYRVVSGGSAVLEELFPGTDHEMVTLYYLDGDELVLTHYCAAGNQPHMVLQPGQRAGELLFDFAGGTNIDPQQGVYMHTGRITFLGPDAVRGDWTYFQDGRPGGTHTATLARRH